MVIVRASDFYGPGVRTSILGERTIEPIVKGKPAEVYWDPCAAPVSSTPAHVYSSEEPTGSCRLPTRSAHLAPQEDAARVGLRSRRRPRTAERRRRARRVRPSVARAQCRAAEPAAGGVSAAFAT